MHDTLARPAYGPLQPARRRRAASAGLLFGEMIPPYHARCVFGTIFTRVEMCHQLAQTPEFVREPPAKGWDVRGGPWPTRRARPGAPPTGRQKYTAPGRQKTIRVVDPHFRSDLRFRSTVLAAVSPPPKLPTFPLRSTTARRPAFPLRAAFFGPRFPSESFVAGRGLHSGTPEPNSPQLKRRHTCRALRPSPRASWPRRCCLWRTRRRMRGTRGHPADRS